MHYLALLEKKSMPWKVYQLMEVYISQYILVVWLTGSQLNFTQS